MRATQSRGLRHGVRRPTRLVPLVFLAAIFVGTALLMLPISRAGAGGAPPLVALFTATSAVAVTGLVTVDTQTYWSGFGQGIILLLLQIGGFGIMTAATLLGLATGRGFRLSSRIITQVERGRLETNDALVVLKLVFFGTLSIEACIAALLTGRFYLGYGMNLSQAIWSGVFHAVSAFNNAGFSLYSDSLMAFQSDGMILAPIMLAVILTALGFPVLQELRVRWRAPRRWSLHTKITLLGTGILLLGGTGAILAAEWNNAATLGPMSWSGKIGNAAFHSVVARTAGFNSVDVGSFRIETLMVHYLLMFIGGGSAGTAGGIKVTTFFLLGMVAWSEVRGREDATIFGRRIGRHIERQALTVALLSVTLIATGTMILLAVTHFPLSDVLFETISAFATVGLSTGITPRLPASGQFVIIVLMFVGRIGTITVASALAMSHEHLSIRYPEERPIVG